jgi:hypothetical protein
MNRFRRTGLIAFAVGVVLVFLGPLDSTRAYGQGSRAPASEQKQQGPVVATLMPLPLQPAREQVDVVLTVPAPPSTSRFSTAIVSLRVPGVIESVAADCDVVPVSPVLMGGKAGGGPVSPPRLSLATFQPNTATVSTLTGKAVLLNSQQQNLALTSSSPTFWASRIYVPITRLDMPCGTQFDVTLDAPPGSTCRTHLIVRYSP